MADQSTPDDTEPKKRVASPGVSGAIKDAIAALSKSFAPKGLTQRGQKVQGAIDEADPGSLGQQF